MVYLYANRNWTLKLQIQFLPFAQRVTERNGFWWLNHIYVNLWEATWLCCCVMWNTSFHFENFKHKLFEAKFLVLFISYCCIGAYIFYAVILVVFSEIFINVNNVENAKPILETNNIECFISTLHWDSKKPDPTKRICYKTFLCSHSLFAAHSIGIKK